MALPHSVKILSIVFIHIAIIGCSSIAKQPIATKITSWQEQQNNINSLTNWHITGKIGFTDGKQGGTASLAWQQQKYDFNISLYGPFKIDTVYITKKNDVVSLLTSEGTKQSANSPEEIIYQQLGWTVPVAGLIYWAKGVPIKNVPIKFIQLSKENRLLKLTQQGWHIEYHDYKAYSKGSEQLVLPTKISLQYINSGDYCNIKIKLIFRKWVI